MAQYVSQLLDESDVQKYSQKICTVASVLGLVMSHIDTGFEDDADISEIDTLSFMPARTPAKNVINASHDNGYVAFISADKKLTINRYYLECDVSEDDEDADIYGPDKTDCSYGSMYEQLKVNEIENVTSLKIFNIDYNLQAILVIDTSNTLHMVVICIDNDDLKIALVRQLTNNVNMYSNLNVYPCDSGTMLQLFVRTQHNKLQSIKWCFTHNDAGTTCVETENEEIFIPSEIHAAYMGEFYVLILGKDGTIYMHNDFVKSCHPDRFLMVSYDIECEVESITNMDMDFLNVTNINITLDNKALHVIKCKEKNNRYVLKGKLVKVSAITVEDACDFSDGHQAILDYTGKLTYGETTLNDVIGMHHIAGKVFALCIDDTVKIFQT